MTDDIKKWDVHFRGSGEVLCVETNMSPRQALASASFRSDWLEMRNGGTINLAHVLAIVPHIDIDEPIPYLPTDPAPATRPILRDGDGDTWVPASDDKYVMVDNGLRKTREYIERAYRGVTEISAADI